MSNLSVSLRVKLPGRAGAERVLKAVSSCIRDPDRYARALQERTLLDRNPSPRPGQMIVVEVLDDRCGYPGVENPCGRDVTLYFGDLFLGVLGNRRSGTNVVGQVPEGPLRVGDPLTQLSASGLIGICSSVEPSHPGGRPRPVRVCGFPCDRQGRPLEIRPARWLVTIPGEEEHRSCRSLFIFGTSAEAGKTTFAAKLTRQILAVSPTCRVAYFKVAGTGRLRDMARLADAGASQVADFVDAGFPTTYGLPVRQFNAMCSRFRRFASRSADVALFEVGGDLLEANAPAALRTAARWGALRVLVANDAMGALWGLRSLRDDRGLLVASLRQNRRALEERLGIGEVVDVLDEQQMAAIARMILGGSVPS